MEIICYTLGQLETNTYLIKEGNDALIIDPAGKTEKVINLIGNLNLKAILLTHGHFDHLKAVDGLYNKFKVPVYLKKEDEELARDKAQGASFGIFDYLSCPTLDLSEGKMNIDDFELYVYFTPGHTEGSVVYEIEDNLFTGDTLFKGSIGRTDLKGGSERKLKESLRLFKSFDRDYNIYPGHNESSTLFEELNNNYYLR